MGAMQARNRPHAFVMKHIMLVRLSTTSSAGLKQKKKIERKQRYTPTPNGIPKVTGYFVELLVRSLFSRDVGLH